jgi:hypothetical protein
MPTGVGAGKAKIFNYRVRGYPGLHLLFLKFGHRNEYGKVRYTLCTDSRKFPNNASIGCIGKVCVEHKSHIQSLERSEGSAFVWKKAGLLSSLCTL